MEEGEEESDEAADSEEGYPNTPLARESRHTQLMRMAERDPGHWVPCHGVGAVAPPGWPWADACPGGHFPYIVLGAARGEALRVAGLPLAGALRVLRELDGVLERMLDPGTPGSY